jgi:hypothetical protein
VKPSARIIAGSIETGSVAKRFRLPLRRNFETAENPTPNAGSWHLLPFLANII